MNDKGFRHILVNPVPCIHTRHAKCQKWENKLPRLAIDRVNVQTTKGTELNSLDMIELNLQTP